MSKHAPENSFQNSSHANIEAIADLEKKYLKKLPLGERFGNAMMQFSSRLSVIFFHLVWFVFWVILNNGSIKGIKPFDPFPYTFLTLVVSLEAIFLAYFVLMGQNAQSRQTDRWAHLDLQVNLLAEQEMTECLKMLRALCIKNGLEDVLNDDLESMIQKTHVQQLAESLETKRMET